MHKYILLCMCYIFLIRYIFFTLYNIFCYCCLLHVELFHIITQSHSYAPPDIDIYMLM